MADTRKIETDEWSEIDSLTASIDSDTLVVWDVDGTLIMPTDCVFFPQNLTYEKQGKIIEFIAKASGTYTEDSNIVHARWYDAWRTVDFQLIDECVPATIGRLQGRGVTNLGLTLSVICTYDGGDLIDWRIKQLNDLGINFGEKFLHFGKIVLDEVLTSRNLVEAKEAWVYAPVFKSGITFTHHWPKGESFELMLNKLNLQMPKNVFFVDDREDNVDDLGATCNKLGINYLGIKYSGCEKFESDWNMENVKAKWQKFFDSGCRAWPKL